MLLLPSDQDAPMYDALLTEWNATRWERNVIDTSEALGYAFATSMFKFADQMTAIQRGVQRATLERYGES